MLRTFFNRLKKRRCSLIAGVLTLALLTGTAPGALASEPQSSGLSLNEAIKLSLQHSQAVKKAGKEMDRTEELRDYANSLLDYVPVGHVGVASVELAYTNALTSQLTWQMSLKSYTTEEDKVILDTCKKYWEILKMEQKEKTAQIDQDAALRQLQIARAAEQVGISITPTLSPLQAVKAAEAQYVGAQSTLAAANIDRDKAYSNFNQLIGKLPGDRQELTDSISYQALEVTDLDHEVSRVLNTAPSIWQADEMVNMQKMLKDITLYSTGSYRSSEASKIEVEQAELDASSARDLVSQLARSMYYQTRSVEEAYNGALEGIKVAEENLRVKKLMFDVGMATAAEVTGEEKKLADAQYTAYELLCSHCYLKLAFEKPWAAQLN